MINKTCPVCENLFNKSDQIYETRCGHTFHSACLRNFLKRFEKCPECENYATIADIHKVNYDSFGLREENIEEFRGTQIEEMLPDHRFRNRNSRSLYPTIDSINHNLRDGYPRYPTEESTSMYGGYRGNIYNNNGTVIICKRYQAVEMNSFQMLQNVSAQMTETLHYVFFKVMGLFNFRNMRLNDGN